MNIFGIGLPEMALIFIVALLIFGPKKLPEIGKSLGKAIKSFQEASNEFQNEFKREAEQIEKVVKEPMNAVLEPRKAIASSPSPAATTQDAAATSNVETSREEDASIEATEADDDNAVDSSMAAADAEAIDPMPVETPTHQEESPIS